MHPVHLCALCISVCGFNTREQQQACRTIHPHGHDGDEANAMIGEVLMCIAFLHTLVFVLLSCT